MSNLYSVKRDEICVGEVITNFDFINGCSLNGHPIVFGEYDKCRSMLFVPSSDGCADDLLYDSPRYPIHGMCSNDICKQSQFILKDVENIGQMLKYYGYGEELDFLDVHGIRTRYFNGKFPVAHCEDFGLMEVAEMTQTFYDAQGNVIDDPAIIKKHQKSIKLLQFLGLHTTFITDPILNEFEVEEIEQMVLNPKFFEILRNYGDKGLLEVLKGLEERKNAFKPHKEEGPIRSLKKYN